MSTYENIDPVVTSDPRIAASLWPLATREPDLRYPVTADFFNGLLVAGGAAMPAEAGRILDALGKGPFIFNLGHGIIEDDTARARRCVGAPSAVMAVIATPARAFST
jgi:hypothetical protein